ncbi:Flagellin FlgL [Ectothiorhodospira magna]|uniref:Flagellin n=1 Tax=Ectothiorhodospira magna TaxID=867345 RepID=A0A1H9A244_9GAMM|nr:flagellin [Ectothiorhodospira magna]SEP70729.1 Flagellin FlgL [Ectothiorhodospira magna]
MSQTINTSVTILTLQSHLKNSQNQLHHTIKRLGTGLRINQAADDASGMAISERLNSRIRGSIQAVRNLNDAISYVQTAEAGLESMVQRLHRTRELIVQAANGTHTHQDRQKIGEEIHQIIHDIGRIATDTRFNNKAILNGSIGDFLIQMGSQEAQTLTSTGIDVRNTQLGFMMGRTEDLLVIDLGTQPSSKRIGGFDGLDFSTGAGVSGNVIVGSTAIAVNNAGSLVHLMDAVAAALPEFIQVSIEDEDMVFKNFSDTSITVAFNLEDTANTFVSQTGSTIEMAPGTFTPGIGNLTYHADPGSAHLGWALHSGAVTDFLFNIDGQPVFIQGYQGGNTQDHLRQTINNIFIDRNLDLSVNFSSFSGKLSFSFVNERLESRDILFHSISNHSGWGHSVVLSGNPLTVNPAQLSSPTVESLSGVHISDLDLNTTGGGSGSFMVDTTAINFTVAEGENLDTAINAAMSDMGITTLQAQIQGNNLQFVNSSNQSVTISQFNISNNGIEKNTYTANNILDAADIRNLSTHYSQGNTVNFQASLNGEDFQISGTTSIEEIASGINHQYSATGVRAEVIHGNIMLKANIGDSIDFSMTSTDLFHNDGSLGIQIQNHDLHLEERNLNTVRVNSSFEAAESLVLLDYIIDQVTKVRTELGALQNRMESAINFLSTDIDGMGAMKSRITDTDYASEMVRLLRTQMLQKTGTAILSQANHQSMYIVAILP